MAIHSLSFVLHLQIEGLGIETSVDLHFAPPSDPEKIFVIVKGDRPGNPVPLALIKTSKGTKFVGPILRVNSY